MEPMLEQTARILFRHPAAALPLRSVAREVQRETPGPGPELHFLLKVLEEHPARFRVVNPWLGPWTSMEPGRSEDYAGYRGRLQEDGLLAGPWIVALEHPAAGSSIDEDGTAARLRESLHAVVRSVDEGSTASLARWLGLVREAARVHPILLRELPMA